jgi:hypothetical protein
MADRLIEAIAKFVDGLSETTGFGRQIAAELLTVLRSEPVLGLLVEQFANEYFRGSPAAFDGGPYATRLRKNVEAAIIAALTPDEGGTDPAQPQSGGE